MRTIAPADLIVGVDTHKRTHAPVALDGLGARLGTLSIPVSPKGYRELEMWARAFGCVRAFGIEGTQSYGAGLSRALVAQGHTVVKVNRPNRHLRYQQGKSDPLDAESAARSVLAGQATARPRIGTRCLIPRCGGTVDHHAARDALWAKFSTAAPARRRRSVAQYSYVKRA